MGDWKQKRIYEEKENKVRKKRRIKREEKINEQKERKAVTRKEKEIDRVSRQWLKGSGWKTKRTRESGRKNREKSLDKRNTIGKKYTIGIKRHNQWRFENTFKLCFIETYRKYDMSFIFRFAANNLFGVHRFKSTKLSFYK